MLGVVLGPGRDALAAMPHAEALRRRAGRADDERVRTLEIAAGPASGERVWPFPCDEDIDAPLDSDIADLKQCTLESDADHILAVRFLSRFVAAGVPWVHSDIASAANKGDLAHIPTEITGFGVRDSLSLLLDHPLMGSA